MAGGAGGPTARSPTRSREDPFVLVVGLFLGCRAAPPEEPLEPAPAPPRVTEPASPEAVVVSSEASATRHGRVVDLSQEPIEGAVVRLGPFFYFEAGSGFDRFVATTDA